MYKNIIFDLGGVLVDFAPRVFLVDHFLNEKVENQLYDITFGSEEWLLMDAGKLSRTEAYDRMRKKAAEIGRNYELEIILADWTDMLHTKEDTVRVAKRLQKAGYNLFYLSNIAQDVFDALKTRKFFSMFSGGLASYETGLLKPDVRIYETLLARYELNPAECLFIDDNAANAAAATKAKIAGFHFVSAHSLARMLENSNLLKR